MPINAKPNEFGVTLMGEFAVSASKAGWKPKNINALLKSPEKMTDVLEVIKGHKKIVDVEHLIDCDCEPKTPCPPADWPTDLIEHRKHGMLDFDVNRVIFKEHYPDNEQKRGYDIQKIVSKRTTLLNANVLEYLLANPGIIPESWKRTNDGKIRCIFFWGSIYKTRSHKGCMPVKKVRYIAFVKGKWKDFSLNLYTKWGRRNEDIEVVAQYKGLENN